MITDGKKWHYLTVKSLSALLKGISSSHVGDFYWLNCFHSYSTKNKLIKYKRVCNDHDYCYIEIANEDNKTLKYNYEEKSIKAPAIIYAECLLEKIHHVKVILKNLIEKKTKHTPPGHSLFANCSFDATKNELDCYKGKDFMERFCKDLRDHAMKIINYEEKQMIPLTDKENKSYEKQKVCYVFKK